MTTPHGPPVPPSAPHAGVTSPRAPMSGDFPPEPQCPPPTGQLPIPTMLPGAFPGPGTPVRSRAPRFAPGQHCRPRARLDAQRPPPTLCTRPGRPPRRPRQLATALPVTSPRPLSGPRRAPDGPGSGARRLGSCPRREGCPRIIGAVEELTQPGHPRMAQPVNPSRPYNPQHSPPDPPGQVSQSASPGPSGPVHLYTDSPTPVAG
jgi:hypothetical protein